TRGYLVVPIQVELYDENIIQMQKDILKRVNEAKIKGVIIDLSAVDIMDSFLAQSLCDTVKMNSMLGASTILTGFQPEVVASIIELNLEFKDIQTAINIEEGFQRLDALLTPQEETLAEIEEGNEGEEEEETIEDTEDKEELS
ncbi:MAG TPA: hypothetical protein DHW70_00660, partial [Candidatus Atribacteria bacterium]|nr:hypothetical protein [Candidatus Atribacteria bacterium]